MIFQGKQMTNDGFVDYPDEHHRAVVHPAASSSSSQAAAGDTGRSRPELIVLHAVRLAGFADTDAVAARVGVAESVILEILRVLESRRQVERFTFADAGGWILTEAGKERDVELLREDVEGSEVRRVLEATANNFESVNSRFVHLISQWQLQSSSCGSDISSGVARELAEIAKTLSDLMAELVENLPRFGRYPSQFSTALEKARSGETQWIAGVGRLSCHTVWAELHEDLLSSLGRDRSLELGR